MSSAKKKFEQGDALQAIFDRDKTRVAQVGPPSGKTAAPLPPEPAIEEPSEAAPEEKPERPPQRTRRKRGRAATSASSAAPQRAPRAPKIVELEEHRPKRPVARDGEKPKRPPVLRIEIEDKEKRRVDDFLHRLSGGESGKVSFNILGRSMLRILMAREANICAERDRQSPRPRPSNNDPEALALHEDEWTAVLEAALEQRRPRS